MHALPTDANRNSEPIRLFKSDFMEFFTHVSPVTIVVAWTPVIVYMFVSSVLAATPSSVIVSGAIMGILLWSAAEYTLHRFVFHFTPRTALEERVIFLFHGIHHAQPQDKTRLVMPLPVSIPVALLFYGLFSLVCITLLGIPAWVHPLMAGFLIGYLAYDLTHYATHHFPMRSGYARYLKRYHMMHHYKDPNTRFGVSSPVWDFVFGTTGTDD